MMSEGWDWMGWNGMGWMVIIGHRSSKSTFGAKDIRFLIFAGYIFGETAVFLLISYPKVKLMGPLELDVCC